MAPLMYSAITSLDGYIADASGSFDWAMPDEEVHAFVNDFSRPIGTHLLGRRMYEIMRFWEGAPTGGSDSPAMDDYARLWKDSDKVVYSTTLTEADTARTRIERRFDPVAVRALKEASDRPLGIGGPTVAAHAFAAGLVDDVHVVTVPVVIGGGTPAFITSLPQHLTLVDQRRFANGFTYHRYVTGPGAA